MALDYLEGARAGAGTGTDWEHWLADDPQPRLVITSAMDVVWENHAARRLLQPPQAVYLRGKSLCLEDARDSQALESRLGELDAECARIPIVNRSGDTSIVLMAHSHASSGQKLIYLVFRLTLQSFSVRGTGLVECFGLTRAEEQIVEGACQLERAQDTATRLGVSVHTVRTHLRQVFIKMGIHSQQQLLRTALAFAGM